MITAFKYLYRDAQNFKAHGELLLNGSVTEEQEAMIRDRLESSEFFIAEQVGVPPLYEKLYAWSEGRTQADHCWHEFVGFQVRVRTHWS